MASRPQTSSTAAAPAALTSASATTTTPSAARRAQKNDSQKTLRQHKMALRQFGLGRMPKELMKREVTTTLIWHLSRVPRIRPQFNGCKVRDDTQLRGPGSNKKEDRIPLLEVPRAVIAAVKVFVAKGEDLMNFSNKVLDAFAPLVITVNDDQSGMSWLGLELPADIAGAAPPAVVTPSLTRPAVNFAAQDLGDAAATPFDSFPAAQDLGDAAAYNTFIDPAAQDLGDAAAHDYSPFPAAQDLGAAAATALTVDPALLPQVPFPSSPLPAPAPELPAFADPDFPIDPSIVFGVTVFDETHVDDLTDYEWQNPFLAVNAMFDRYPNVARGRSPAPALAPTPSAPAPAPLSAQFLLIPAPAPAFVAPAAPAAATPAPGLHLRRPGISRLLQPSLGFLQLHLLTSCIYTYLYKEPEVLVPGCSSTFTTQPPATGHHPVSCGIVVRYRVASLQCMLYWDGSCDDGDDVDG